MCIMILLLFICCIYSCPQDNVVLNVSFKEFFLQHSVLSPFSAITLAGLVLLVFLAGLIGGYIFFTLMLGFLSTYAVLTITCTDEETASEKL